MYDLQTKTDKKGMKKQKNHSRQKNPTDKGQGEQHLNQQKKSTNKQTNNTKQINVHEPNKANCSAKPRRPEQRKTKVREQESCATDAER